MAGMQSYRPSPAITNLYTSFQSPCAGSPGSFLSPSATTYPYESSGRHRRQCSNATAYSTSTTPSVPEVIANIVSQPGPCFPEQLSEFVLESLDERLARPVADFILKEKLGGGVLKNLSPEDIEDITQNHTESVRDVLHSAVQLLNPRGPRRTRRPTLDKIFAGVSISASIHGSTEISASLPLSDENDLADDLTWSWDQPSGVPLHHSLFGPCEGPHNSEDQDPDEAPALDSLPLRLTALHGVLDHDHHDGENGGVRLLGAEEASRVLSPDEEGHVPDSNHNDARPILNLDIVSDEGRSSNSASYESAPSSSSTPVAIAVMSFQSTFVNPAEVYSPSQIPHQQNLAASSVSPQEDLYQRPSRGGALDIADSGIGIFGGDHFNHDAPELPIERKDNDEEVGASVQFNIVSRNGIDTGGKGKGKASVRPGGLERRVYHNGENDAATSSDPNRVSGSSRHQVMHDGPDAGGKGKGKVPAGPGGLECRVYHNGEHDAATSSDPNRASGSTGHQVMHDGPGAGGKGKGKVPVGPGGLECRVYNNGEQDAANLSDPNRACGSTGYQVTYENSTDLNMNPPSESVADIPSQGDQHVDIESLTGYESVKETSVVFVEGAAATTSTVDVTGNRSPSPASTDARSWALFTVETLFGSNDNRLSSSVSADHLERVHAPVGEEGESDGDSLFALFEVDESELEGFDDEPQALGDADRVEVSGSNETLATTTLVSSAGLPSDENPRTESDAEHTVQNNSYSGSHGPGTETQRSPLRSSSEHLFSSSDSSYEDLGFSNISGTVEVSHVNNSQLAASSEPARLDDDEGDNLSWLAALYKGDQAENSHEITCGDSQRPTSVELGDSGVSEQSPTAADTGNNRVRFNRGPGAGRVDTSSTTLHMATFAQESTNAGLPVVNTQMRHALAIQDTECPIFAPTYRHGYSPSLPSSIEELYGSEIGAEPFTLVSTSPAEEQRELRMQEANLDVVPDMALAGSVPIHIPLPTDEGTMNVMHADVCGAELRYEGRSHSSWYIEDAVVHSALSNAPSNEVTTMDDNSLARRPRDNDLADLNEIPEGSFTEEKQSLEYHNAASIEGPVNPTCRAIAMNAAEESDLLCASRNGGTGTLLDPLSPLSYPSMINHELSDYVTFHRYLGGSDIECKSPSNSKENPEDDYSQTGCLQDHVSPPLDLIADCSHEGGQGHSESRVVIHDIPTLSVDLPLNDGTQFWDPIFLSVGMCSQQPGDEGFFSRQLNHALSGEQDLDLSLLTTPLHQRPLRSHFPEASTSYGEAQLVETDHPILLPQEMPHHSISIDPLRLNLPDSSAGARGLREEISSVFPELQWSQEVSGISRNNVRAHLMDDRTLWLPHNSRMSRNNGFSGSRSDRPTTAADPRSSLVTASNSRLPRTTSGHRLMVGVEAKTNYGPNSRKQSKSRKHGSPPERPPIASRHMRRDHRKMKLAMAHPQALLFSRSVNIPQYGNRPLSPTLDNPDGFIGFSCMASVSHPTSTLVAHEPTNWIHDTSTLKIL